MNKTERTTVVHRSSFTVHRLVIATDSDDLVSNVVLFETADA